MKYLNRKTIIWIEPVGSHGGMENYNRAICDELVALCNCLHCYTVANDSEVRPYEVNLFEKVWMRQNKLVKLLQLIFALVKLASRHRKKRVDIVHLHTFGFTLRSLLLATTAHFLGSKIIATVHDVQPLEGSRMAWVELLLLKLLDGVILHNDSSLCLFQSIFSSQLPSVVIPHPLYQAERKNDSISLSSVTTTSPDFNVLYFGRDKDEKDLPTLLHAIGIVKKQLVQHAPGRPIKLRIIGRISTNREHFYKNLIRDLQIGDAVEIQNRFVPDEEIDSIFQTSDVVVLPYLRIYQSGVLLQAMSRRRPVIATDIPGMRDSIKDRYSGLLFPPRDASALAELLVECTRSPQLLSMLAANAEHLIKLNNSPQTVAKKTVEFYGTISN